MSQVSCHRTAPHVPRARDNRPCHLGNGGDRVGDIDGYIHHFAHQKVPRGSGAYDTVSEKGDA
jgi:hypothetical protein